MINYGRKNYADKRLSYIVLDIESNLPKDLIERYESTVSFYCLHWCKDIRYFFNIFFLDVIILLQIMQKIAYKNNRVC